MQSKDAKSFEPSILNLVSLFCIRSKLHVRIAERLTAHIDFGPTLLSMQKVWPNGTFELSLECVLLWNYQLFATY